MTMSCVRCSREQLYSSFLSNFQISQVHPYLDTHNYNIATTTWVLKHTLFVITCSYKALTIHCKGKQWILYPHSEQLLYENASSGS